MGLTAGAATRTGDTDLFPYRLSLPRAHVPRADLLVWVGLLGDLCMIAAGLVLGYWLRFNSGWIQLGNEPIGLSLVDYGGLIGVGALFLLLTFGYLHLYNPRRIPGFRDTVLIVLKGTTFWLFAFLSFSFVIKFQPGVSRIYVFSSYFTCLGSVLVWRWIYSRILRTRNIAKLLRKRILFVGWTPEAARVTDLIAGDAEAAYQVAGWIPAPLDRCEHPAPAHVAELGDCTQLPELLHKQEIDVVILTYPRLAYEEIVALANLCERELIEFKIIPSYFQILLSGLRLEALTGVPVLGVADLPLDRLFNRMIKRGVDVLGAIVGLIFSAPIIAFCGLLIRLESPGPIFYRQVRTGRNGKNFTLYKLRSMRLDAEKDGPRWAQADDPRCLRLGAFLRHWKLDEFPQFWNVLRGDMSLVGPRPERPELISNFRNEVPHYNARLACKPGITGWAQVNGTVCNTNLEERIRYDLHYLENWSLWLDLQTIFHTFFVKRYNTY